MLLRLLLVAFICVSMTYGGYHPGERNTSLSKEEIEIFLKEEFKRNQERFINLYGPAAQKSPVCNSATLTSKPEDAHLACTKECGAISSVVNDGHKAYPKYYPIRKLHRECYGTSGFTRGECLYLLKSPLTWCKCHGSDFWNAARYCRGLIFAVRVGSNTATSIADGVKHYWSWRKDFRTRQKLEQQNYEQWFKEHGKDYGSKRTAARAYKDEQYRKFNNGEPTFLAGGHGTFVSRNPSSSSFNYASSSSSRSSSGKGSGSFKEGS